MNNWSCKPLISTAISVGQVIFGLYVQLWPGCSYPGPPSTAGCNKYALKRYL